MAKNDKDKLTGEDAFRDVEDDPRGETNVMLGIGESVQGIYVGRRSTNANGRETFLYVIRAEPNGAAVEIWDSAMLSRKMAKVSKGKRVKITRMDDIPSPVEGYSPEKNFKVSVA